MSKRRRASSVASRGDDPELSDNEQSNPPPPTSQRKRKKLEPVDLCRQLYDVIRSHKKEDGTLLCDSFIRAPKRRQEPSYYEIVSQPIDLLRVQQKLKTEAYEDIEELSADIELLVNNSKAFYKPDSIEYNDAQNLWELFIRTKQALENGEEIKSIKSTRASISSRRSVSNDNTTEGDLSETSTNNDDDNVYEELFASVMAANIEGRSLYSEFMFLPSRELYPEYFDLFDNPIDLKTVASKIQAGEYQSLTDMERDLLIMVRNACTFNEPGSQIYKDAKQLKRIIQLRKQEIEKHERAAPSKTSERIRSKRYTRIAGLSSAAVALMEPDLILEPKQEMDSDGDESDGGNDDPDSPQWKLLDTVKNYTSSNGQTLADPFCRMPSRRFYPDYYKKIKNPISLNQIKMKIRRGGYGTVSEVAGDLNIMFENAKNYNEPTSKLYRDAIKLQKVMQQRVAELLDMNPTSSSEDESLSTVKAQTTPRPRGRPKLNPTPPVTNLLNSNPAAFPKAPIPLRKKLHTLARYLMDLTLDNGRKPMLLFMEKPSKKLYPDYYNVIENPIDMLAIDSNIKNDLYKSLEELVSDLRLMFSNCRQYNEENSKIYEDALVLEKAMNDRLRELAPSLGVERRSTPSKTIPKRRQATTLEKKLKALYDAVKDYRDPKGNRQLSVIFMKLPSKTEYPDYYELIKSPIDMDKIQIKMRNGTYQSVGELASDFILMFDNACKYNEPDSQIYKDALVLQKLCLQTKQMLREDDDSLPDVPGAVQDLLLTLFTSVYNHQDEEGRCYSDSMAELPEHDEGPGGEKVRAISLDLVKRRLDRNLYKRLDHFQEDLFAVFERARRLSRTDSQIFEDAVELQAYYINQRDELCHNTLESPALIYTRENMQTAVELVRQCKLLQENTDEDETRSSTDDCIPPASATISQTQYNKGDFLYVANPNSKEPNIVQVVRSWNDNEGNHMIYANVYFRPQETFHVRTRRFLEREVFKTEIHRAIPIDQVLGRCFVANVKDYFKFRPQGYADKDVYVCESRYNTRTRSFKKIKNWEGSTEAEGALIARDVALEATRTHSVFQERLEKHRDELAELDILENLTDRERPDVVMYKETNCDDENTYYEQYNTVCGGCVKTGDFVYVVSEGGKQVIAQIDGIWETNDNKCFFRGPFLMFSTDVGNVFNKSFYKQEVLMSSVYETSPMVSIVGKCSVLTLHDYLKCRPTEISENDVWLCQYHYDEGGEINSMKAGLTKYTHSKEVTEDEIYYFPKAIGITELTGEIETGFTFNLPKQESMDIKPNLTNLINTTIGNQDVDMLVETSMDDSSMQSNSNMIIPPVGGGSHSGSVTPVGGHSGTNTPSTIKEKKKKGEGKKLVTGYILYSSEVRKAISAGNPECTFGEISRIVGNEWRNLSTAAKQSWEEKATKCNEETAARLQEEMAQLAKLGLAPAMETVYECCWDTCDFQFEELADCIDHCIGEGGNPGHIQQHYRGGGPGKSSAAAGEYPCLWRTCARLRKGQQPFPNLPRLLRHVRDLHINKGNGKQRPVDQRSKNYVYSTKKQMMQQPTNSSVVKTALANTNTAPSPLSSPSGVVTGGSTAPGMDPLFVAAPPKPQMVKHSEAYIRYIEGLHSEQKYITPWEKSLTPAPSNVDAGNYNVSRLPTHWLSEDAVAGYVRNQSDVHTMDQNAKLVKALWSLRDFMVKDALLIHRNL